MKDGSIVKKLLKIEDERGKIIVLEDNEIPFTIKRVFVTFHKKGVRGNHAHKKTEQVVMCLKGSMKIKLINSNLNIEYELSEPYVALYIPPMTWTELYSIAEDSVILVFASERYEKLDYIGDLEAFMSMI